MNRHAKTSSEFQAIPDENTLHLINCQLCLSVTGQPFKNLPKGSSLPVRPHLAFFGGGGGGGGYTVILVII